MARKRPIETTRKVTVELTERTPPAMFLRVALANGKIGGVDFDLCQNITGDCWILELGGRQFTLGTAHFVEIVYKAVFDEVEAAGAEGG